MAGVRFSDDGGAERMETSSGNTSMEDGCLVLSPARPRCTLAELTHGMKPGDLPATPGRH
jgi:hypothetical protein